MITHNLRKDFISVCQNYTKLLEKYKNVSIENKKLKELNDSLSEEIMNLKNDLEVLRKKNGIDKESKSNDEKQIEIMSEPLLVNSDEVIEKPKKTNKKKKNTSEESLVDEPIITDEQKEDNNIE